MWTWYPELLERPVPRYTSYPTAAEFTDDFSGRDMADALDAVALGEPVSLYVHIPYCREICWYCGCNTGAANRSTRLNAYLERLEQEIELVGERLGGRGTVSRIAFGGGSPNAIAPDQFERLAEKLADAFPKGKPVLSVEVDPRGFDRPWADALGRAGVTRVSLGVQTFASHVQAAIGRVQPREEIVRTVELLRSAGADSINFDLMYGLPGQSEADLVDSLDQSVALGADRLAVFGYAHVPHMIPRQRRIDASVLPGARQRFAHAALAHARLTAEGYAAVGFDHFARPGDALAEAMRAGALRRNFQGFTEDQAEVLIGLGATSISAFPDRLLQNEKNTGRYHLAIGNGHFAASKGVRRDAEDRRRGRAIEALLCTGSAELAGIPGFGEILGRLQPFEERGLVRWQGMRLSLTSAALPYARVIASTLDRWRAQSTTRFSNAV